MSKKGPRQKPRAERFFDRVGPPDPITGCREWTAGRFIRGGYGAFYDDDAKLKRAHRVAVELATGKPLLPEEVVAHSCDNPPCVERTHLRRTCQADNLADMRAKGRGFTFTPATAQRGEARYNRRLTEDLVKQLREAYANGASYSSLARALGTSRHCVTAAINGETWSHVGR